MISKIKTLLSELTSYEKMALVGVLVLGLIAAFVGSCWQTKTLKERVTYLERQTVTMAQQLQTQTVTEPVTTTGGKPLEDSKGNPLYRTSTETVANTVSTSETVKSGETTKEETKGGNTREVLILGDGNKYGALAVMDIWKLKVGGGYFYRPTVAVGMKF
jgi:hypothetical protein